MDRCPNCDQKVRVEGSSGVFGTKNFFLSDELVKEINSFLPEGLIRDKICNECVSPAYVYGGIQSRIDGIKEVTGKKIEELQKERNKLYLEQKNELTDFIRLFSIVPENFHPISIAESIVIFDSGARSTSSDNFEAGIWNVINDSIALTLGNTNSVKEALAAAKVELQIKAFNASCNTVAALKPVYSDLAANGKILLHLTGTIGVLGEFKPTEQLKSLQSRFEKLDKDLEKIEQEKTLMAQVVENIKKVKYYTN